MSSTRARIRSTAHWIYVRSVFYPRQPDPLSPRLLATFYHRGAAIGYFVLALWSLGSIGVGVPTLEAAQGTYWQITYSLILAVAALIACFGATFFQSRARTEMVAGVATAGLLMLYAVTVIITGVLSGNPFPINFAGFILYGVPSIIGRCAYVVKALLRQADQ